MARAAPRTIPITSRTSSTRIAGAPWNPVPASRLELRVAFQIQAASGIVRQLSVAWLDTGAPISYLPASLRNQGLLFQPTGTQARGLNGVQCDIVTTEVYLMDDQGNAIGPLVMLAKLATAMANPVSVEPVLIGLEFLQYHAALVHIDLTTQPFGNLTI